MLPPSTLLSIKRPQPSYRGRFAPSPSGHLHFGSLIAALASFLDAKSNLGTWLVRIEDIDPPREKLGASEHILTTLDIFGLHWDEPVMYQSQQSERYQHALQLLQKEQLSYYCQCTRAQIKQSGGIYQGTCQQLHLSTLNNATRLINNIGCYQYHDLVQGNIECNQALAQEDFTLVRKDGLFAYQLAVVLDDIEQDITHVVRGCDLLDPTARQLSFYQILQQSILPCESPQYAHVPLAITDEGYKLSKQNKAPAIDHHHPQPALIAALLFLGQQPPSDLINHSVTDIIQWAIKHWDINKVPKKSEIVFN
jgi:glutamyl-Q tRNA(Asp) synthetase